MNRTIAAVLAATATLTATALGGCTGGAGPTDPTGPTAGTTTAPDATGTTSSAAAAPSTGAPGTRDTAADRTGPARTVVVVLENHGFDRVIADDDAPWLNGLPAAVMTDWHGVTHPSQPNYLALFTGSTHGVDSNDCPVDLDVPSLGGQLIAAGHTFVGYSEGLPEAGSTVCRAGRYARKHNPWVDVRDVPPTANQPMTAFPTGHFEDLPTVSFVVPDLCHDSHDCSTKVADAWLRITLGPYLAWAADHDGLLVVTYDEQEDEKTANHIPTLFAGPRVSPGRYADRGDHYRLLRTLEDLYGLAPLGRAAGTEPLTSIWAGAR